MKPMVNELSRGDEHTRTPEEHLQQCMDGFDYYVTHTICRDKEELGTLLLALVKDYRDMLQDMCKSVFYNYVGEDDTQVVADNENTLTISVPQTTLLPAVNTLDVPRKVLREGAIYIQRDGHLYDIVGKQID
jgi:hypothetical protein